jgi:hypothetical protein
MISLHDPRLGKTFEIDRENPGFFEKTTPTPPFQYPGDATALPVTKRAMLTGDLTSHVIVNEYPQVS